MPGTPPEIPLGGSLGLPGSASLTGYQNISLEFVGSSYTLSPDEWWSVGLRFFTGTPNCNIIFPSSNVGQIWAIINADIIDLTLTDDGGGGPIVVSSGATIFVIMDSAHGITQIPSQTGLVLDAGNSEVSIAVNTFADAELAISGGSDGPTINFTYDEDATEQIVQNFLSDATGTNVDKTKLYQNDGLNLVGPNGIVLGVDDAFSNSIGFFYDDGDDEWDVISSAPISFTIDDGATIRYILDEVSMTDVTADNVFGTAYQNPTNQNMQVSGYGLTSNASTGTLTASMGPDGSSLVEFWSNTNTASVTTGHAGFCFTIPPGWFYQIDAADDITGVGLWMLTFY